MDYRVEYWRSSDGTVIASGRGGSGYPLLEVPAVTGGIELFFEGAYGATVAEATVPEIPSGFEYVTYDRRGTGLSESDPSTDSPGLYIDDIAAVVRGLGYTSIAVSSRLFGVPEAVAFAVRHPDLVSHLVLQVPILSVRDWLEIPRIKAVFSVLESDWEFATEAWQRSASGWQSPRGGVAATWTREHWTPDQLRRVVEGLSSLDVTEDFARIDAPTLVLHSPSFFFPDSYVRDIASAIPHCQLKMIPATEHGAVDRDASRSMMLDFLSAVVRVPQGSAGGFSTILFTDVVSSTPLLTQLRDERMRAVMRDHEAVCEAAITEHGGRVVKTIGDAFMAEFSVPSAAIEAAIAIQRGVRETFENSDVPIRLRIGINAGEPIVEDDDLHGASVVIAKRLESTADEGGILVSDVVRQAVAGKDFEFEDRGEVELKGFDQPVRAWAVRWD